MSYITGVSASTSTQGGYLTDNNGHPKLWVSDQNYGLITNAGRWNGAGGGTYEQDYDNYFSTRAAQGVTALLVEPVGSIICGGVYDNGNTWDDVPPCNTGTDPASGLNSAYWTRIDYMMNSAQSNGITLLPIFDIQYNGGSGGGSFYTGWTGAQYQAWGAAIGTRYASQPNILWMFGDDTYAGVYDTYFTDILTGLRGAGDAHRLPRCGCQRTPAGTRPTTTSNPPGARPTRRTTAATPTTPGTGSSSTPTVR